MRGEGDVRTVASGGVGPLAILKRLGAFALIRRFAILLLARLVAALLALAAAERQESFKEAHCLSDVRIKSVS